MNTDPEFENIVRQAKALPRSIQPSRDLWPDIAGELRDSPRRRGAAETRRLGVSAATFFANPVLMAASVAFLCALVYWTWSERSARSGWAVATVAGAPRVGSQVVSDGSKLRRGQWIETDSSSRARVSVGTIGSVDIDPNSRVRLVSTAAADQRLELARGTLHAVILAPPRIFFVDTPAATAVDLGCMYTISVDDSGRGILHVTSGYVALAHGGRETIVRAGMMCATRPGLAPGTPYPADAPGQLRLALERFDFESSERLPDVILAARRPEDARTLLHVLSRVQPGQRASVYDAILRLIPVPEAASGVTRDAILRGDQGALERLSTAIDAALSNPPLLKKIASVVVNTDVASTIEARP